MQQGIILTSANSVGYLLQYIFHFYVSRLIGPSDYSLVTAMLALSVIVTVPGNIAQTVITQYTSTFYAHSKLDRVAALLHDTLLQLSVAGGVVFLITVVMSGRIAAYLNVPAIEPVIAMAVSFPVTGAVMATMGVLQGLQRFDALAAGGVLGPLLRLIAAIILVHLGLGAVGAIGASTVMIGTLLAICLFCLRDILRTQHNGHGLEIKTISRFTGIVFLGTLAFSILTNVDLIIVRHYFSPEESGYYSAASVLGKTILFLPTAVTTLMFPKTAQRFALGQSTVGIARKAMLVSLLLCGAIAITLAILAEPAVEILFGSQFASSIPLVGGYGAAMGLYALVQLLLILYISQEEARFVWLVAGAAILVLVMLMLFHTTLAQVILILAMGALFILIVSEAWLGGLGLAMAIRHRTNESA